MSAPRPPDEDPEIAQAVRRRVGIATLRRLHRMIAADQRQATRESLLVRRLAWGCAVAALLVVVWLAFR